MNAKLLPRTETPGRERWNWLLLSLCWHWLNLWSSACRSVWPEADRVEAPAVAGNEEFERYFRVHYNTMEHLILFIPGVWFFAQTVHVYGAVGLGVVYLIGRAIYAISYVKDPATRTAGTLLSMFPLDPGAWRSGGAA